MYTSIIASDMLTIRGAHPLERMDDLQLADLGIERNGRVYLHDGKVVYAAPRLDVAALLGRMARTLTPRHRRAVRA